MSPVFSLAQFAGLKSALPRSRLS